MPSISRILLPYVHSSILLATTVSLVTRDTEKSPPSISNNTANHSWVTTSLFGCSVVSAIFHFLLVGNDVCSDLAVGLVSKYLWLDLEIC